MRTFYTNYIHESTVIKTIRNINRSSKLTHSGLNGLRKFATNRPNRITSLF